MRYIIKPYHHNIPDKELLADLRRTAKKHGKQRLKTREFDTEGTYSRSVIRSRFGSWNKALLKAGLKIILPAPKNYLIDNLERVWNALDRQPSYRDMGKPVSEYSTYPYKRVFGSWRKALEFFIKFQARRGIHYPELTKRSVSRPGIRRKKKMHYYVTDSLRFDIMKRDRFKCRLCGTSPAVNPRVTLHVDHIIPRAKNGKTTFDNLQTLCSDCNYGKRTKDLKM